MKDYNYMSMKVEDICNFVKDVHDMFSDKNVNDIIAATGINYRTVYRFLSGESLNTEVMLWFIQEAYEILENRVLVESKCDEVYKGNAIYEDDKTEVLEHYSQETLIRLIFEGYDNI